MPSSNPPAINAATRLCAVFGSPIKHSASPAMHNAAFAELNLNWRYLAFEVDPKNLRAAIAGARAMNFAGINLTVPHKLLAVDMVDELDASAKIWGAVNTIQFISGNDGTVRAIGYNTDADGLAHSLRDDLELDLRGAKVLLLGAGGAGRTAALKLAAEKVAELFLVNRTQTKAESVAAEIKKLFPSVKVFAGYPSGAPVSDPARLKSGHQRAGPETGAPTLDLVLNATSLGLKADDASPLDEKKFPLKQTRAAYDMIYQPAETAFLHAAKAAGCQTANGIGMLVGQGAKAFEIWTGQTAPLAVMRRAVEENVYGGAKS